jgi:NADPH-dependent curcumin reductase CurA
VSSLAAVDYKDSRTSLAEQLHQACPDGIDFYFDNVVGSTLDAVLFKLNHGARDIVCGAISQYSNGDINSKRVQGPANSPRRTLPWRLTNSEVNRNIRVQLFEHFD